MANRLYVIAICFFIVSCVDKKQKQFEKDILGDWKLAKRIPRPHIINGEVFRLPPPFFTNTGISFIKGNNYINKEGFFEANNRVQIYIGNNSKYRIENESLGLYNPFDKSWTTYLIDKLTADSLILDANGDKLIYIRLQSKTNSNVDFDRVVLSTSGCFGSCPIMSISVEKNGTTLFQGTKFTTKTGLYSAAISGYKYKTLIDAFAVLPLDSVKDKHDIGHSDSETITTTFVKNGHIIKTVNDYGRAAPAEFTWAYVPLRYLYQDIQLKPINIPDVLKNYQLASGGIIKRGNLVIDIWQSEMFLLYDYLSKGKVVSINANHNYNLKGMYFLNVFKQSVSTDGRFYTFNKNDGSKLTIDIGINFLKDIEKLRNWRTATEYDR